MVSPVSRLVRDVFCAAFVFVLAVLSRDEVGAQDYPGLNPGQTLVDSNCRNACADDKRECEDSLPHPRDPEVTQDCFDEWKSCSAQVIGHGVGHLIGGAVAGFDPSATMRANQERDQMARACNDNKDYCERISRDRAAIAYRELQHRCAAHNESCLLNCY